MLFIRIYGIQMLLLPCLCNVLLQCLDEAVPILLGSYTFFKIWSLFIPFLSLLQRDEPLIHVLHDQLSELIHIKYYIYIVCESIAICRRTTRYSLVNECLLCDDSINVIKLKKDAI